MRELPLVSIVTPSFNQGRYIKETIESVLRQDYPHIEYLVLDGGSTDHTLAILKRYEGQLRWVSERDRGQADAINKGFRMARGEILGWLNSDDTYMPQAIHKVVEYFQTHRDVGMVYGEGYHIDAAGRILERYCTEPFSFRRLAEVCFICQPTVFLRTEVVRAIGPVDVGLRYCLDYDYWIRIAKRFRIQYLGECLANTRLHIETKTLSQRAQFHREILQTVKNHYDFVPVRWLYAYATAYLNEKFLPHLQGIHADGWATQRASVLLPRNWKQYRYLSLEGELVPHTNPISLRITVGDHVVHEVRITHPFFEIKEPLWKDGIPATAGGIVEVNIDADSSFSPQNFGISDDTRALAYRVHKLAFIDEQEDELVLYSERRAWLQRLALPLLVLWKSLLINQTIPYKELGTNLRQLCFLLQSSLATRRSSGLSQ